MAQAVVEEIRQAGGIAAANHDTVATTQGCEAIVSQALAEFGKVDVLINNAGIMRNRLLADTTDEDWDAVLATHVTGSFKLTRAVWPHMQAQKYGRIVYTSSSAGIFGNPMVGGYGAAKAAIAGLMHVAALEGEDCGILCNAIMPNAISRMAMQAVADWTGQIEAGDTILPEALGNSMSPEFNTPLAVFLASERCTHTRGLFSQCIGRSAKVFIGAVTGWQAPRQSPPNVNDIAAHWDEICDGSRGFIVPLTVRDEREMILARQAETM